MKKLLKLSLPHTVFVKFIGFLKKKPIDNISMTKSFGVLHFDVDLLGPVAISIDANDWDFYR